MSEVEAFHAIGLQFDKTRGYDGSAQVDDLTLARAIHNLACFMGHQEVFVHQLAGSAYSTVREGGSAFGHDKMYGSLPR